MRRFAKRFSLSVFLSLVFLCWGPSGAWAAYVPGISKTDIYAVQAMLQSLGLYQGTIDGIYGSITASGVKTFQQKNGLTTSGQIDMSTLRLVLQSYSKQKMAGIAAAPDAAGQAPDISEDERFMAALVNQARAEAGLTPLTLHMELFRVARIKSGDMAENEYFSHDSPTYGSPFQMMNDFGIRYSAAGENIACNHTVEKAHEALMNSPGHRANILSDDYTHIGIGVVSGGRCGVMTTQMFLTP